MIQYPFWLVTPSDGTAEQERLPLAFSTVERMSGYLNGKTSGHWAVQLVNRYSVAEICGELRKSGIRAVCYDAENNGTSGVEISLDKLLSANEVQ